MLCPEATRPAEALGGGSGYGVGGTSWDWEFDSGGTHRAWVLTLSGGSIEEVHVTPCSYGLNGWLFRRLGRSLTREEKMGVLMEGMRGPQPPSYTNIFLLRRTANVPLLLDCAEPSGLPTDDEYPPAGPPGTMPNGEVAPGAPMGGFLMDRHSGQINGLFLDWSVRKIGLKELWTLKWYETFDTANRWTTAGGVKPEDWPPYMLRFRDY